MITELKRCILQSTMHQPGSSVEHVPYAYEVRMIYAKRKDNIPLDMASVDKSPAKAVGQQ